MTTKGNVVLYLDRELVEKSKEMGFNLSKTFENHLKHLINGNSLVSMQNKANSSEYKGNLVGLPVPIPERVQNLPRTRRQDFALFKKLAQARQEDLNPHQSGEYLPQLIGRFCVCFLRLAVLDCYQRI